MCKCLPNRYSMSATAKSFNIGSMCKTKALKVLLGPLWPTERQHLSPLHFLHGEQVNTANQYRE